MTILVCSVQLKNIFPTSNANCCVKSNFRKSMMKYNNMDRAAEPIYSGHVGAFTLTLNKPFVEVVAVIPRVALRAYG